MYNFKSVLKGFYLPWIYWGLGAAFFFLQYATRVSPSVMTQQLMQEFHVGAFAISALSSSFYLAYISMQVPVGILLDYFSTRRLLTLATLVAAFGCFIFASAHYISVADAGLLLAGLGAAFGFVSALKLAADWFPANKFGMLAGATQACGMLGAVVGVVPVAFAVNSIGWRHTLIVLALFFTLLSFLIFLLVRDKAKNDQIKRESKGTLFNNLLAILRNRQSWLNAAIVGLMFSPITGFGALWGVRCLTRIYNISTETAASALSVIYIGWMLGGPIMGWLSDRICKRRPILVFSAISCAILFAIILYVPHIPIWLMFVLMFILGMANSGASLSYAISKEVNHPEVSGTAVAFANMASVMVGTGFLLLIGWLLDFNWDGLMSDGVRLYSVYDFHFAMLTLVFCYFLAAVGIFFLKETHCENVVYRGQM